MNYRELIFEKEWWHTNGVDIHTQPNIFPMSMETNFTNPNHNGMMLSEFQERKIILSTRQSRYGAYAVLIEYLEQGVCPRDALIATHLRFCL